MEDLQPGPGEVPIRVHASGINHGDVIKRQDWTGHGMAGPGRSRTRTAPA
ncbi:hypothetical protein SSP24_78710 [Streptomyces spinoverrucosus]|uniref:Uncharacterized protein n=1 Tax=Streptomyces spinoverrucosus TaxID=284043 RepID=A0A4Y3VYV6_9ACTN|nr:hypothetical protein SSP24_78710 [Streptomyces spinoverrucosus]GHB98209.1 hypothetical protein GCM10010397_83310 [Streptomyces spinoverrucosus]